MAKVCLRMLENPNLLRQLTREETQLLVLRVMVRINLASFAHFLILPFINHWNILL